MNTFKTILKLIYIYAINKIKIIIELNKHILNYLLYNEY